MENIDPVNISAAQNTILNILAASKNNYEFPGLQREAVDLIASNITNIVYESLQKKNPASSTKRYNLLKFLNTLCQAEVCHTNDTYKIYLNALFNNEPITASSQSDVEKLLNNIREELEMIPKSLKTGVAKFYNRKNLNARHRVQRLEFIKRKDQEKFGLSFTLKNISHYETSADLLNNLLANDQSCLKLHNETRKDIDSASVDYRKKQIKFCYALVNLRDEDNRKLLKNVLEKLSGCKQELYKFEMSFLMDLWLSDDVQLTQAIVDHFPFILEKIIIKFCTQIIKIPTASEMFSFFSNLETNCDILKLRTVCAQNQILYYKLKSLVNELYVFSYCNRNVLRLADYIV